MPRLRTLRPKLLQRPATQTHNWKSDEVRGSPAERGYDYAWRKVREVVLRAANELCQCPDCQGGVKQLRAANQVHHKVGRTEALRMGWTREQIDALSNLMAINSECHEKITGGQHSGGY